MQPLIQVYETAELSMLTVEYNERQLGSMLANQSSVPMGRVAKACYASDIFFNSQNNFGSSFTSLLIQFSASFVLRFIEQFPL